MLLWARQTCRTVQLLQIACNESADGDGFKKRNILEARSIFATLSASPIHPSFAAPTPTAGGVLAINRMRRYILQPLLHSLNTNFKLSYMAF